MNLSIGWYTIISIPHIAIKGKNLVNRLYRLFIIIFFPIQQIYGLRVLMMTPRLLLNHKEDKNIQK